MVEGATAGIEWKPLIGTTHTWKPGKDAKTLQAKRQWATLTLDEDGTFEAENNSKQQIKGVWNVYQGDEAAFLALIVPQGKNAKRLGHGQFGIEEYPKFLPFKVDMLLDVDKEDWSPGLAIRSVEKFKTLFPGG